MKKNKNMLFFVMFMGIWITLILMNFFAKKVEFSEQENRILAKIPKFSFKSLVDGEYARDLDEYINDHFIGRNVWIKIESFMDRVMGKTENNNVYIGKDGYLFEKFNYKEKEEENINLIVNRVEEFSKDIEIPSYFMILPNSIYIKQKYLPDNVQVANQKDIINNIYSRLNNIKTIDVVTPLEKYKDKYVYFKTDHHMTSYGAYIAYVAYCNEIGIKSKTEFKSVNVSSDFLGTFDSKAQVLNQEKDKIDILEYKDNVIKEVVYDNETSNSIYNEEYLNVKDKYSYFLNGNNSVVVIKTNVNNGRKLLVIKDSYAHIMAQFLPLEYEEVHFVDPRYYNASLKEYIKENGITENLFMYNLSNLVTDIKLRAIR